MRRVRKFILWVVGVVTERPCAVAHAPDERRHNPHRSNCSLRTHNHQGFGGSGWCESRDLHVFVASEVGHNLCGVDQKLGELRLQSNNDGGHHACAM